MRWESVKFKRFTFLLGCFLAAGCERDREAECPCRDRAEESAAPLKQGAVESSEEDRATVDRPLPGAPDVEPRPLEVRANALQGDAAEDRVDAIQRELEALAVWAKKHGGVAAGLVVRTDSGRRLAAVDSSTLLNPASTQKLLTAAGALELLGPNYRFETKLHEGGALEGGARLVLVGGGAPDLKTSDLWRLARLARQKGVDWVSEIVVDQGRFAPGFLPPAYEEQPDEWAAFRAPISALAIDRNTITLNVDPTKAGEEARVWFEPPGLTGRTGHVLTLPRGQGDRVSWSLVPSDGGLESKLGGGLAEDASRRRYPRRLDDPTLAPGQAFAALLAEMGVELKGSVNAGRRGDERLLGSIFSEPIAVLLRELGKESDNFTAEMVAVALSARLAKGEARAKESPWSTERGLEALRDWLIASGISTEGLILRNGSGLFGANLISPEVLVAVLRYMAERSSAEPEYTAQLAIGGLDGTLKKRFFGAPWAGRVRAKTGTLQKTNALAGYVFPEATGARLAFSFIVGGIAGRHTEARERMDRVVRAAVDTEKDWR